MPPVPRLLRTALAPFQAFARLEASSGILLALCAAGALLWANSPWAAHYEALFTAPRVLEVGGGRLAFSVREFINDGLMTLFFFLVGMEIQRELVTGELRTPSRALLPLIAALGGMLVPAALYAALNAGTPAMKGWAIPMATDIAFAIGCLTLLRSRVGHGLVVFLTALAIFDDIGGILVIALFYGSGLHAPWLLGALGITGLLWLCRHHSRREGGVYAVLGALLWYTLHHGGVHATISGVLTGVLIPPRAPRADVEPPLTRFVRLWHGWVGYGIVPLFALANSGIGVRGLHLTDLLAPLPLGVMGGLFVGKQVGVFLFTWASVKAGLAPMPGQARLAQLHGVAVVAGIGFTVALFVAGLAFAGEPPLLAQAKLGILLGSLLSAGVGFALLRLGPPAGAAPRPDAP